MRLGPDSAPPAERRPQPYVERNSFRSGSTHHFSITADDDQEFVPCDSAQTRRHQRNGAPTALAHDERRQAAATAVRGEPVAPDRKPASG